MAAKSQHQILWSLDADLKAFQICGHSHLSTWLRGKVGSPLDWFRKPKTDRTCSGLVHHDLSKASQQAPGRYGKLMEVVQFGKPGLLLGRHGQPRQRQSSTRSQKTEAVPVRCGQVNLVSCINPQNHLDII